MNPPLVSIGLPVFNGENYLSEALGSILEQSYEGFELVISDNASTDRTEDIAREFMAKDPRVRFIRNDTNLGAAANYGKVFHESRGRYFKWAAHDDICHRDFLARCLAALEASPDAVLAYPRTAAIGPNGEFIRYHEPVSGLDDASPAKRFTRALAIGAEIFLVWGLIRRQALGRTRLLGSYVGHDRPLLSSLSLLGRFVEVPDVLLYQREHPNRSVNRHDWRRPRAALSWYDTAARGRATMPAWRLLGEHGRGVAAASLDVTTRLRCLGELGRWAGANRIDLWIDLVLRSRTVPFAGPVLERLDVVAGDVNRIVPPDSNFILVDDDTMQTEVFAPRRAVPYVERDGMYWGPPADDDEAVRELERLRCAGAGFVVFTAQTFWWIDHYAGLRRHLEDRYRLVLANSRYRIFDLGHRP